MPEKKSTTNKPEMASPKVALPLPNEEEFRAYLRTEAVRGVQALLESVMKAELEALIGCGWGEVSAERKGYRNGYYQRDLTTSTGAITDLKVPRDRDGHYQTQVFEKYQRQEPEIREAITEMYVAGASTTRVGGVVETLTGKALSDSTVSRITSDLEGQFQEWRGRPLQSHYRIFYLDAIRYQVRHKEATDPFVVLAVLAVDLTGKKEVLSLQAYAEETKVGWLSILGEVRERGAAQVDLIVTDGHKGLTVACDEIYTATPRQRCFSAQRKRHNGSFSREG
jgi:transposase-like protein